MEFFLKNYIKEDVQSNLSDADLLSQAAQLEAKKNAAKKTLDQAQERYNNEVQQIDNQMVQLLNTQAQRNAQKASAAKSENESQNLNEGGDLTSQIVYLDYFMPSLLGAAYDEAAIKKTLEKEGLVVEDNYNHGLILHISEPNDLEVFYQVCDDNGLDRDEVEEQVLYQLPR